jgi:hypothetical protein
MGSRRGEAKAVNLAPGCCTYMETAVTVTQDVGGITVSGHY